MMDVLETKNDLCSQELKYKSQNNYKNQFLWLTVVIRMFAWYINNKMSDYIAKWVFRRALVFSNIFRLSFPYQ